MSLNLENFNAAEGSAWSHEPQPVAMGWNWSHGRTWNWSHKQTWNWSHEPELEH